MPNSSNADKPRPADLPYATWSGTFRIFGVDLRCHLLSSGERIIEAESMAELMKAMEAPSDRELGDIEQFYRWKAGA